MISSLNRLPISPIIDNRTDRLPDGLAETFENETHELKMQPKPIGFHKFPLKPERKYLPAWTTLWLATENLQCTMCSTHCATVPCRTHANGIAVHIVCLECTQRLYNTPAALLSLPHVHAAHARQEISYNASRPWEFASLNSFANQLKVSKEKRLRLPAFSNRDSHQSIESIRPANRLLSAIRIHCKFSRSENQPEKHQKSFEVFSEFSD